MPRLGILLVRAALVWLLVGFTLGALVLANKGVPVWPWLWTWRLSHVHMLLVGWTVQMAMGVAHWILPRLGGGSRGDERPVWLSFWALNLGVLLAALHDPLVPLAGSDPVRPLPVLAGVLYLVALAAFVAYAWRRVLPLPEVNVR